MLLFVCCMNNTGLGLVFRPFELSWLQSRQRRKTHLSPAMLGRGSRQGPTLPGTVTAYTMLTAQVHDHWQTRIDEWTHGSVHGIKSIVSRDSQPGDHGTVHIDTTFEHNKASCAAAGDRLAAHQSPDGHLNYPRSQFSWQMVNFGTWVVLAWPTPDTTHG
jgi:hypothetical protein